MSNKNEQSLKKPKQKNQERLRLEQITINKYGSIWGHEKICELDKLYSRVTSLTIALDEKKISYGKDLKTAIKFSPFEFQELRLPPEKFKNMVAEISLQQLRHINEDFDIVFFFLDEGHTTRNLHSFIVDYQYKLANFGKPKPACGYDPNYAVSSSTAHRSRSTHPGAYSSDES